jgi:hypothetical protein
MPYLGNVSETDRLEIPGHPDCWVEMKVHPSYADGNAAQDAMLRVTQGQKAKLQASQRGIVQDDPSGNGRGVLTTYETAAYFGTLLLRLIVGWNLTDAEGRPLPITLQAIAELPSVVGRFLQSEAERRLKGRPAEDDGPFETASSPSSPEAEDGLRIETPQGS